MAALTAMDVGKRKLFAKTREQEEQRQAQQHDASQRQPTLHELWGIPSQSDDDSSQDITPLKHAEARAIAEFWTVLNSFAFLHDNNHEGQWWAAGSRPPLSPTHPFLAGTAGVAGSVKVMVPNT
jgi:hypothetical protein